MKKITLILGFIIIILLFSIWQQSQKEIVHNADLEETHSPSLLHGNVTALIAHSPSPLQSINFTLNQSSTYPGDCISLYIANVKTLEEFSISAPFYEKALTFFPYENGYVTMIPIYVWLSPGNYQIEAADQVTDTVTTLSIEVFPKTFDVQYLKVNESTATIYSNDNAEKDQVYFDASRANPIKEKLWEGPFIQPAQGEITTQYNSMRYTNDNPIPSRHLAIDIANSEGTVIQASNNGRVVLARELIVTGNSVVIDHGMGVFTSSFHMSEISVSEGATVSKGDPIGKMGSTGYSTGPHLHFAIWKDGNFLNPWYFFEKDPIPFTE